MLLEALEGTGKLWGICEALMCFGQALEEFGMRRHGTALGGLCEVLGCFG